MMGRITVLAGVLWLTAAAPALADVTAFLGTTTTPNNRRVVGLSGGLGLFVVLAVEFEYSSTSDDLAQGAPSLKTGSGNVLLQTPLAIHGFQPYVTTGVGFYSEAFGAFEDKGPAFNTGGGVKISLAGPLGVRVDYRVFKLGSGALFSPAHRFYAGLNLKF